MTDENKTVELDEAALNVLKLENKYYQEVKIAKVNGTCPYGHKEGDVFKVTAMNSDGICGSLLKSIFSDIITLHYGGNRIWETDPEQTRGCCPENGLVEAAIRRVERPDPVLLKTPTQPVEMIGKGYTTLDRYRLFVEVQDIAVNCYWGHKIGDRYEVDPFNVGGLCCFLYTQLYPYLHVLLAGTSPPWAFDEHTVMGECPDTYDRLCYRLFVEER